MNRTAPATLALLLGLTLTGCASAMSTDAPTAGAWVDRATYEADPVTFHGSGDVVLFFNATWCPTCQATVKDLDADGVPPGLTVVSVDYDAATV